jgi:hypothetical protein
VTDRTGRTLAAMLSSAAASPTLAQDGSPPSSLALVRPEIMRSSTSVSHAKGSTPFSGVTISKPPDTVGEITIRLQQWPAYLVIVGQVRTEILFLSVFA